MRLTDIMVDEVSLVDKAANKRRFYIVKRDESVDEKAKEQEQVKTKEAVQTNAEAGKPTDVADTKAVVDEFALDAEDMAALEVVAKAVEELGKIVGTNKT